MGTSERTSRLLLVLAASIYVLAGCGKEAKPNSQYSSVVGGATGDTGSPVATGPVYPATGSAVLATTAPTTETSAATAVNLFLQPHFLRSTNIGFDQVSIDGQTFDHALEGFAPSPGSPDTADFALDGQFRRVKGVIGAAGDSPGNGTVTVTISVDDNVIFGPAAISPGVHIAIDVDVTGAEVLHVEFSNEVGHVGVFPAIGELRGSS